VPNILYVGRCPPHRGGPAIRFSTLFNHLAEKGYVIRALDPITPHDSTISGGYSWKYHDGVQLFDHYKCSYYTTVGNSGSDADRKRYAAYMEDLLPRLVAADKPDLILVGGEYFANGLVGAARRLGIPTVLTPTGGIPAYFRGVLPKEHGQRLLADASEADLIIACAAHLGEDMRAAGFDNVEIIQNFIDTEKFSNSTPDTDLLRQLDIHDDDIIVLHASNMVPQKRVLDIAGAARLALERDPRLVFVVVGDGPCLSAFKAACDRDGTAERFRFVGWIDHSRMPAYYRIADVVVLPSETEGLALNYLESQACGRVICASDIPAASEVITHGHTGLLFPMGNIRELADTILLAADDRNLRGHIGAAARAFVCRHHSLDQAAAKYQAVFERLSQR